MQRISAGDVVFLVLAGLVLLMFSALDANASTYFLFLLFVAATWTARRTKREMRSKTAALTQELEKEKRARSEEMEVLRTNLRELQASATPAAAPFKPAEAEAKPSAAFAAVKVAAPAPIAPATAAPVVQPTRAAGALATAPPKIEVPIPPPPQKFAVAESQRDWAATIKRLLDFEQMLGTNWLSKLGVAVLVLGIAFFLAWQLRELGPAGKVTVGIIVGGTLLAAGVWGERFERYRILARAALAGGWPLLFFVAYAAYHVAAARVLDSPLTDLFLMFLVVAVMVADTLRFRSQVVTGLAFILAFSTVGLNRVDVYSLTANVVLAIGLCFVALRVEWYELEIFGMVATYVNHFIWLMPIIEPMQGKVHPFPQFFASAAILLMYWAVFRASYVVRPPVNERLSAVAGVLNTVLLLGVLKYQSAHPEWAFWGLLALGMVELALGQLVKARGKRMAFVVLSTIGVAAVVAAIPFRYAAQHVSPIWLVQAELFFALGIATNERVFRRLGSLAAAATATHLFAIDAAHIFGARLDGSYVVHEWTAGAIFCAATVALYADAHWAARRWPEFFSNHVDQRIAKYLTYAAALLGAIGAWVMFPVFGAAVGWMAIAVTLAWAGTKFEMPELIVQANLLAFAAVLRALFINLPYGDAAFRTPWTITYRAMTVVAIAALGSALSRWNRAVPIGFTKRLPQAATWAASAMVTLLAWYELKPASVALGWMLFAVIIFEIAERRNSENLRAQAYVAFLMTFLRLFIVNLNAEEIGARLGPRIYTTLPVALGMLYVHERLYEKRVDSKSASVFAWMGVITAGAMLRFELAPDYVVVGWAAGTFALAWIAFASRRRVFLHIAIAMGFATVLRGVLHNLYERSYFPWPGKMDPWVIVGGAAGLMCASLVFAFRMKRELPQGEGFWQHTFGWLDARPEQILFFLPLALTTLLLGSEMRKGALTMAWGIEAVAVFVFALWIRERSYRLAGLVLLLLCVGKIFVFDFWSLGIRDKALTGITLGLALIGVSVLYTRKREAIKQFL